MTRKTCSWCGQSVPLLRSLLSREFCSPEHQQAYLADLEKKATSRLTEYLTRTAKKQDAAAPSDSVERSAAFQERRASPRVSTELRVDYRVPERGAVSHSGRGLTVNMSEGGILFTTEGQLPQGESVEVRVTWPTGVRLAITGRLVRCETQRAALACERFELLSRV